MSTMVQSFKEMGNMRAAMIAGGVIVALAIFAFLLLQVSRPSMTSLFTNLSMEDSGKIAAELDRQHVPYEIAGGGSQILVPADQALRLRVALAEQGMPANGAGVGYEIFDKSEALGTSNFVLNVNYLRALEGELARTIGAFQSIDHARVHLVIPKRELFTRDRREPSASVALNLRGNNRPSASEIAAIKHLVATAVPGLTINKITIVDNKGRLLAKGVVDENDPEVLAASAEEHRISYEKRVKHTVEDLLERVIGLGKVNAEVAAEIDFDRTVVNSETYDPEGQVARSVQTVEESEQSTEKELNDTVSVGNNLPNAAAGNAGTSMENRVLRTDETTNFEISKVVKNHVKETGNVRKLSVAVLVDGIYSLDANGNRSYQPRDDAELAKLEELVKSAVGYDEARGDTVTVVNMPFSDASQMMAEGPMSWLTGDMRDILQTLVICLFTFLLILLVVRPLFYRMLESSAAAAEEDDEFNAILESPEISGQLSDHSTSSRLDMGEDEALIAIERIEGRVKSSALRKINDMIEKHPEETATIIQQWLLSRVDS